MTFSVISGITLFFVVVPSAVYYYLSRQDADENSARNVENYDKVVSLLNEIRKDESNQLTELFTGGNELCTNIEKIQKMVELLDQRQRSNYTILNNKLNLLQVQTNTGGGACHAL